MHFWQLTINKKKRKTIMHISVWRFCPIKGVANMKLHTATFLVLVIGGLNWLLVGLFQWDIGSLFGGQGAWISRIIYILVGLSAVYEIVAHQAENPMKRMAGVKP